MNRKWKEQDCSISEVKRLYRSVFYASSVTYMCYLIVILVLEVVVASVRTV